MNRFLKILALPLLMLLVNGCVDDTLDSSHTAEMYYVDLLYALHHQDQEGAKDAAHRFAKSMVGFPITSYPGGLKKEEEYRGFYLKEAEHTFMQVQVSIEKGELEQAMIQLNRATNQLKAARIPGFEELYIAGMQDFLSLWLEVSRTSRKEDLGSREWQAINRRIRSAHTAWRQSQMARPSPSVYFFSVEDTKAFNLAHGQVDRLMGLLVASLAEDDVALTKSYVDATDSVVWALVRCFGSPAENGLEIIPTEI